MNAFLQGYMQKQADEDPRKAAMALPGAHKGYIAGARGNESRLPYELAARKDWAMRQLDKDSTKYKKYLREGGPGKYPALADRMARHYMSRAGGFFPRARGSQYTSIPAAAMWDEMGPLLTSGKSDEEIGPKFQEIVDRYPQLWGMGSQNGTSITVPEEYRRHSAPVTQQALEDIKADLPGVEVESLPPDKRHNAYYYKKKLSVPGVGSHGLPTLLHEYTHAVDPVVTADEASDRRWNMAETEVPATVTERAVEASPYLPSERRRPFVTPMGKQIEKFGPTLRGNFRGDLGNIRDWMQALRRMPNAGIQAKKPFAYHGDTRTPQQRAQALGVAYQNWMNRQAGQ